MKKLSELIQARREKIGKAPTRNLPDAVSTFYFTDISPLTQDEIDSFWWFEGSALERAIELRKATRSAEEAVAAAFAWDAGKRRPCHRCGERFYNCECFTTCSKCGTKHQIRHFHSCGY